MKKQLSLNEFNALIGQDSYVRCQGKKRIDSRIVDQNIASSHIDRGGTIGWWLKDGYIVVDIDEGKQEALKIIKNLGLKTLMSQTPKGLHLYFKCKKEYPQRIKMVLPFGLKCDFRCANKGYVILPYGEPNRKFNSCRKIAELPDIFTPLFNRGDSLLGLKDGDGRNSTLFSHLMAYKNRGASETDIELAADLINTYVFAEPMGDKELQDVVKHTKKYEAKLDFDNPYVIYSDKGKPLQINARAVCDYFVNTGEVVAVGSECYRYKDGVYQEASSYLRNLIKSMVGIDNLIIQSKIMETYRLVVDDIRIQRNSNEFNKNKHLINFKNGVWNVETRELLEHDSAYLQTIQIPHDVSEPTEFVPFKDTYLYDFFKKTKLPKEDVKMMLKYMAYCLTVDYGLKTFMVLVGRSNTGKSVLIRFVESLVGSKNTAALGMHELNKRFYPSQLHGKLLNSCADNKTLPLSSIENLKKVTGGDQIMHEKKGKEPFFFVSFAKLLFSFNQLPLQLEEKSDAFYKRMRVMFMDRELFLDNEYVDRLCSEESIKQIIPHLLRLLPLKQIPRTKMSNECVNTLRQDSDSIHDFITKKCVIDSSYSCPKDELFNAYVEFCIDNGRESHKKHGFMRAMRSNGFSEGRSASGKYIWKGVKLDG